MMLQHRKTALKFAKELLILATLWLVTLSIVGANWSDRPLLGNANIFELLPPTLEAPGPPGGGRDNSGGSTPLIFARDNGAFARDNGAAVNVINQVPGENMLSVELESPEPGASYIRISP